MWRVRKRGRSGRREGGVEEESEEEREEWKKRVRSGGCGVRKGGVSGDVRC